jgi:hypothetical protein
MAKRVYSVGMRTFELVLTEVRTPGSSAWTVEKAEETSDGRQLAITDFYNVVASTEDAAIARACDRIDKWLMLNR